MEAYNFCQSCGMPLDKTEVLGSESDGSKSVKYCRFCYVSGKFVNPDMTLDEMKVLVRTKLEEIHMPESMIQQALITLPMLGRWMGRSSKLSTGKLQQ